MADQEQEQEQSLATTFPNPPPFWREFTPEKLEKEKKRREEYAKDQNIKVEDLPVRIPGATEENELLQPPAPPKDGIWRLYGQTFKLDNTLPTLEEQGITALITPQPDTNQSAPSQTSRILELKRLAKSVLLNYLELIGTLAHAPADADPKIQDIRTIFINMHHLMNEYRPHQARESAIEMMQAEIERKQNETKDVRAATQKAKSVLEGLASLKIPGEGEGEGEEEKTEEVRRRERKEMEELREIEMWRSCDEAAGFS